MTDENRSVNQNTEEVRKELDELLAEKLEQLENKVDAERFKDEFQEKAQQLEREKEEHYLQQLGSARPSRAHRERNGGIRRLPNLNTEGSMRHLLPLPAGSLPTAP